MPLFTYKSCYHLLFVNITVCTQCLQASIVIKIIGFKQIISCALIFDRDKSFFESNSVPLKILSFKSLFLNINTVRLSIIFDDNIVVR